MTNKRAKKKLKNAAAPVPPPVSKDEIQKEKEEDLDMLEDIKRDEDLYISESDVAHIANFIRTTNKSFSSLGNAVVSAFSTRCSLAILHALLALFDVDGTLTEDYINRLNIIYIVWRLPELEQNLRLKPTKTMADIYTHPYATFLFWAEQLEQHPIEATLARIIVTNNVGVIEKLTAVDFQKKAESLDLTTVDRQAFERWAEANTDHWPEISEELVSLSKAMKVLGCEKREYEAASAEAFYPLVHNAPTIIPPRMRALDCEDKKVANFRKRIDPNNECAEQIIYSTSAGPNMAQNLRAAFAELEPTVLEYQSEVFSGMTQSELDEAQRIIEYDGRMVESSASSDMSSEDDSDSDIEPDGEYNQVAQMHYNDDDKTIEGCIDRILDGHGLTSSKSDQMAQFVKMVPQTHPQWKRLCAAAAASDEMIMMMCRVNNKICGPFLVRTALCDKENTDPPLFHRYMKILQSIGSAVQALECVVKLSKEFVEMDKLSESHRDCVLDYVRYVVDNIGETTNPQSRSVRLVAMLVRKLLCESVLTVEDVSTIVKPFCLRFTENRECTYLYQMISGLQTAVTEGNAAGETSSTTTTSSSSNANSMTTTTTTTTSVNKNTQQTTTTTTTMKQCGPAMIKQTSRKVVLQSAIPSKIVVSTSSPTSSSSSFSSDKTITPQISADTVAMAMLQFQQHAKKMIDRFGRYFGHDPSTFSHDPSTTNSAPATPFPFTDGAQMTSSGSPTTATITLKQRSASTPGEGDDDDDDEDQKKKTSFGAMKKNLTKRFVLSVSSSSSSKFQKDSSSDVFGRRSTTTTSSGSSSVLDSATASVLQDLQVVQNLMDSVTLGPPPSGASASSSSTSNKNQNQKKKQKQTKKQKGGKR